VVAFKLGAEDMKAIKEGGIRTPPHTFSTGYAGIDGHISDHFIKSYATGVLQTSAPFVHRYNGLSRSSMHEQIHHTSRLCVGSRNQLLTFLTPIGMTLLANTTGTTRQTLQPVGFLLMLRCKKGTS
jgi:hypothetical protein